MDKTEKQKQAFLAALSQHLGVVTKATEATGIERATHLLWIQQDQWYADQVAKIADKEKDFARAMLQKAAQSGDLKAIAMLMEGPKEVEPKTQVIAQPPLASPKQEPRKLTPATKNEAKAKAFMLQAMARNDVMGVAFAAIEAIGDAEKWDDETELFDLSFATHEKWLESDPDYAKSIQWLEAAGLKAQRQGHWLSGLSMMGEDASVWKAMAAIFEKLDKAKPAADAPANPYADMDTAQLLATLQAKVGRVMKAVS